MNNLMCRRDFVKGSVSASALVSASSAFGANRLAKGVNEADQPIAAKSAGSFEGPLILPGGKEYVSSLDPLAKEKPLLGKKIAVLVETEYIYDEIEYYRRRIPALGGEVSLLAYLWGKPSLDFVNDIDSPDRRITDVHRLTVTECVTKHDPSEFDIVICAANYVAVRLREVPPVGSLASPEQTKSAPAVQFFARAMENRKILKAAMCHALWILTPRPDLLNGRRVICHTVVLADIHNAGAVYVPAENHVVVDNDLVTARSFADIEPYFDRIVAASSKFPPGGSPQTAYVPPGVRIVDSEAMKLVARQTAVKMCRMTFVPERIPTVTIPTAEVSKLMAEGKYDFAKLTADIQTKLGISGIKKPAPGSEIMFVAADHGVWASEMTLAMKAFVAAGYHITVATLSGKAPMFLPVSMNEKFEDPTWGAGWVVPGEAELGWQVQKQLFETEQKGEIVKLDDLVPHRPQAKDGIAAKQKYEKDLGTGLEKFANVRGVVVPGGTGSIIDLADNSQLEAILEMTHDAGNPIAGICYGTLALLSAEDGAMMKGVSLTIHNRADDFVTGTGALTDAGIAKLREHLERDDREGFVGDGTVWTSEWRSPTRKAEVEAEAICGPGAHVISPYTPDSCAVIDSSKIQGGKGAIITGRSVHCSYDAALAMIAQQLGNEPLAYPVMMMTGGEKARAPQANDYNQNTPRWRP